MGESKRRKALDPNYGKRDVLCEINLPYDNTILIVEKGSIFGENDAGKFRKSLESRGLKWFPKYTTGNFYGFPIEIQTLNCTGMFFVQNLKTFHVITQQSDIKMSDNLANWFASEESCNYIFVQILKSCVES